MNKIEPGANYGWPVIEGSDEKRGMKAPLIHSGEKTWAPSGLAQKGDVLYMAGLRGEGVFRVDPAEAKAVKWLGGYGRIRDVKVIGDDLYFYEQWRRKRRKKTDRRMDRKRKNKKNNPGLSTRWCPFRSRKIATTKEAAN